MSALPRDATLRLFTPGVTIEALARFACWNVIKIMTNQVIS